MTKITKYTNSIDNLQVEHLLNTDNQRTVTYGYKIGKNLHACRITATQKEISAQHGIFNRKKISNIQSSDCWHETGGDQEWIFSILSGSNPSPVYQLLCIPLELRESIQTLLQNELANSAKFLSDHIDTRAITALSKVSDRKTQNLQFYTGDSDAALNRRQAAECYPFAAEILATNIKAKISVDRQLPLAPVMRDVLEKRAGENISKGLLKRLTKAPKIPKPCSLDQVLTFSTHVPLDWIPADEEQWEAFCFSAKFFLGVLNAPVNVIPKLVNGRSGDWVKLLRKISSEGGHDPESSINSANLVMLAAQDMLVEFADTYIIPVAAKAKTKSDVLVTPEIRITAIQSAFKILNSGRSALCIAENVRRWSNQRNTISEEIQNADGVKKSDLDELSAGAWPALTDKVESPSGLQIIPLNTPEQLEWEGLTGLDPKGSKGLAHCISSYTHKARTGDCHIVSIREKGKNDSYKRLCTIEFDRLKQNQNYLNMRQAKGFRNSVPSAKVVETLDWFIKSVALNQIPINWKNITSYQEKLGKNNQSLGNLELRCGYDWRVPGAIEKVAEFWEPFIAGQWKEEKSISSKVQKEIAVVSDLILPDIEIV